MAETLPPLTAEQLRAALQNPSFSSYIYVGSDADDGWKAARAVHNLLPAVRIYLALDSRLIQEWLAGDPAAKGIVFGWGATVRRYLNEDEAGTFLTVLSAIQDARQQ
jgi:hypothetical protein